MSSSPSEPDEDSSALAESEGGANTGEACVVGTWTLDTENAGTQLWTFLQSTGVTQAADVDVSGESTLTISSDGAFELVPDLDIAATISMNGIEAVLWQEHSGQFRAHWSMDDADTMRFDSVSANEYSIDQALTMAGVDVPMPFEIPPPVGAEMPLDISCEGDMLIYSPPDAPMTSVWRRVS